MWLAALTQFAVVVDGSMATVLLPALGDELGVSVRQLAWVATGYAAAFAGLLLLAGRLADDLGIGRVYAAGLTATAGGTALAAAAGSLAPLVAGRALQGAGGALAGAAALALILRTEPPGPGRNRALGLWGAVGLAGIPAGTVIAGVVATWLSWRWALLVNLLLCAMLAGWALRIMRGSGGSRGRLDAGGCARGGLAAVAVAAIAFAVSDAGARAGATRLMAPAAGVLLLCLFVALERRGERPLLPAWALRWPAAAPALVAFAGPVGAYGINFALMVHLQRQLDLSALQAGLVFLPYGFAMIASARLSPRLIERWGARLVVAAGGAVTAASALPLLTIGAAGPYLAAALAGLVLLGLGSALFFVAIVVAALAAVDGDAGVSGGLLSTVQQLGGALGIASAAAVYAAVEQHAGAATAARTTFAVDGLLALLAGLLALRLLPAVSRRRA